MSADNRSISTDALATLGTIIKDGGRDAIHLAVEPVIAGEELRPAADIIDSEWWSHWESITGKKGERDAYFSCSC